MMADRKEDNVGEALLTNSDSVAVQIVPTKTEEAATAPAVSSMSSEADKAIRGQVFISTFPIAKSRAICQGKEKGWLPPSPFSTFFPTSLYPL